MSERTRWYVHTQGDPADVLFQLPSPSRRLAEGNIFTVEAPDGSEITYKVETVNYRLVQRISADNNGPLTVWGKSSVGYGVSIVP